MILISKTETNIITEDTAKICEVEMKMLSPLLQDVVVSGGSVEITVTGSSMYPMLKHRQSKVRLAKADTLHIGDIPLYRRKNGSYVLHRIVGTEDGKWICCGDHQWTIEKGICDEQIIAVTTHFKRTTRWVACSHSLYTIYWKFWLLIRPVRYYAVSAVRRIVKLFQKIKMSRKNNNA